MAAGPEQLAPAQDLRKRCSITQQVQREKRQNNRRRPPPALPKVFMSVFYTSVHFLQSATRAGAEKHPSSPVVSHKIVNNHIFEQFGRPSGQLNSKHILHVPDWEYSTTPAPAVSQECHEIRTATAKPAEHLQMQDSFFGFWFDSW